MKTIQLNNSKSIQARILVLQAISALKGVSFEYSRDINNCDDIDELYQALQTILRYNQSYKIAERCDLNIKKSGTALRFIIALCASIEGEYTISCGKRLSERPIKPLLDALLQLGADICCEQISFCHSIIVKGKALQGGLVNIDASVSSQFISALMLIAPRLTSGIEINLEGNQVSSKYIHLTADIIRKMGGVVHFYENKICVPNFVVNENSIDVEKCWSSAAIWFALMAVEKCDELLLQGLDLQSSQPDRVVVEQFGLLGVSAKQNNEGVILSCGSQLIGNKDIDILEVDFNDNPDSVMVFAVAACLNNKPFRLLGLSTLKDKECDRVAALINECAKCGFFIEKCSADKIEWRGEGQNVGELPIALKCYDDHRMAMALSLFKFKNNVVLDTPNVVSKSYPLFWRELDKILKN